MRKSTLLKVAGTLAAVMFSFGVMAQSYPAQINHAGDVGNYTNVPAETILHTTGLGLKLYVAPDPIYSPSYTGTSAADLNANSEWRWVFGADYATGTQIKNFANENWVELTAGDIPAVGTSRTFWVLERFGALGCVDPLSATSKILTTTGEPDATMVGANTGAVWTPMTAGLEFYRCGDGHTDNLTLTFSETSSTVNEYAYSITATTTGYDIDGNIIVATAPAAGHAITVAPAIGTFVASPATAVIPAMTFVQDGGNNVRTRYQFTLSEVGSRISALSHFRAGIANALYAPTAPQVVTYWLNLPPVTGPIYHIPNNYTF